MMATTNITVTRTWTLVAANADSALLSAVAGYGEVCKSTGAPVASLKGHPIAAGPVGNSLQVTGEIYARAAAGSNEMLLALT